MVETKGRNSIKTKFAWSRTFSELMGHTEKEAKVAGKAGQSLNYPECAGRGLEQDCPQCKRVRRGESQMEGVNTANSQRASGSRQKMSAGSCRIIGTQGKWSQGRGTERLWDHSYHPT